MDCTAAHCDGYSPRCSCTNRTARSRTSGENLLFLLMAPFSQKLEPPQNPGRFSYLSFNLLVRFNAPRGSDEAFLAEGVAGMAQACALSQGRWPREALNSGWRFRRTPVVCQCAWRG